MIRNEAAKAVFFETLIQNQREEVISWLRFKYRNLPYADAEDIYQEASVELWKKFREMDDWCGESLVGLLKTICRNVYGHWIRHQVRMEEWDDVYFPQDNGVEADYGYISSEKARMLLKEFMYANIDRLNANDRSLIELHLQNVRMDQIARELGFRNAQVARNRKCKIVVKLCKDINAQADKACASLEKIVVYSICTNICKKYMQKADSYGAGFFFAFVCVG